jgi:hypothetical protein
MRVGHSETDQQQTTKNGPSDLFSGELAGSSSSTAIASNSSSIDQVSFLRILGVQRKREKVGKN